MKEKEEEEAARRHERNSKSRRRRARRRKKKNVCNSEISYSEVLFFQKCNSEVSHWEVSTFVVFSHGPGPPLLRKAKTWPLQFRDPRFPSTTHIPLRSGS
jgi:hypothetical protein